LRIFKKNNAFFVEFHFLLRDILAHHFKTPAPIGGRFDLAGYGGCRTIMA
jgi:hypothetical protein